MIGTSRMFIGYFFIAVMAIFGIISILNISHITVQSEAVLNGDYTAAYEKKFDHSLPHYDVSTSLWKFVKYKVFNEGLDGVVIGRNGWLFTSEEIITDPSADLNFDWNIDYIDNVVKRLNQDKVQVIIVPVPAKARVYQDQLKSGSYPSYKQGVYQKFITALSNNKIHYVDLLELFNERSESDLYFKTDTHWTSEATKITAQAILKSKLIKQGRIIFKKNDAEKINFQGDLVQYVNAKSYPNEELGSFDLHTKNFNNLFGEQYFPVVLVGTSYSADQRWGFEKYLKLALRYDVLNVSDKGLGPFKVMDSYMNSFEKADRKPELIIWEIPERYLTKKSVSND